MKRLLFAATTSGTGKTTICCGIMRALKNKGFRVQPYKVGPDYIDIEYHSLASGTKSRNLDEFMLPSEEIKYLFANNAKDKDINIVEGVMGLYDGLSDKYDYCSSASMSKLLDMPVILIIDAKAMAASAAALVLGFKNLDKDVKIAGVIANNVSSDSHFNIIKNSIENYAGVKVLGRIPKDEKFSLSSRHLGLTPSVEIDDLDNKLNYMAEVIEKYINLDELLQISEEKEVEFDVYRRSPIKGITDVKLGLAYDKAFNFYYQDSLDLLKDMGVEFVSFSPINDDKLPDDIDGVFLGGGFPEVFAKEISDNKSMLKSIREKSIDGMPIYAECGGLMYLGKELESIDGDFFEMTGILNGKSIMSKRLQRFGYCVGKSKSKTLITDEEDFVRGHEFHYSDFISEDEPVYEMEKTMSDGLLKKWNGGFKSNNTFGTYLHTHFAGNYQLALNFVKNMEEYRNSKK